MQTNNSFIKKWLILAVSALAGAGIYSLPPVLLRSPALKDRLPVEEIFASTLVVHVDLSVLVWMLAIGGMLWSTVYQEKLNTYYKAAFYAAVMGTLLIALSPIIGQPNPLKNNYIPVLQNPFFFIGLGLFASGILTQIAITMASYVSLFNNPISYGLYVTAVSAVLAMICFIIAAQQAPEFKHDDALSFYEHIFWGGGHILQVTYTTLMIIAWFMLLQDTGYNLPNKRLIYITFAVNLIISLPTPFFYFSDNSTGLFASHMRNFIGIAPIIAYIGILRQLLFTKRTREENASNASKVFLIFSLILFAYGGLLAFLIRGADVTIPAHYHGSIVGISLAFMGLVHYFMPLVGFKRPTGLLTRVQPYIYAIGQIIHITGLAVMGGYGALRKDAASSQNIDTILGKALFFSGGSLAILGGLLFVIVTFLAMRKNQK